MEDEEESILKVDWEGNRRWYDKKGAYHRLDGPAIIHSDGDIWWCNHGKFHREDGPARIWAVRGIEQWWKDGEPYEPSAHELMVWKMKMKKKE